MFTFALPPWVSRDNSSSSFRMSSSLQEEKLKVRRRLKTPDQVQMRKTKRSIVLKVVLLASFLLLLPFWLLGGSGSFDLRRQSVDVDAVIFGTEDESIMRSINQYLKWITEWNHGRYFSLKDSSTWHSDKDKLCVRRDNMTDEKLLTLHFLHNLLFHISPPTHSRHAGLLLVTKYLHCCSFTEVKIWVPSASKMCQ